MVRKIVAACALIALLAIVLISVCARQAYRFWIMTPETIDAVTVTIEDGGVLSNVIPQLADEGLVHPLWFKIYAKISGKGGYIQSGTFEVTRGMSYAAILDVLQHGMQGEGAVTIPEGFTIGQIGERVMTAFPHIGLSDWEAAVNMNAPLEAHPFVVAAGKPDDVDLEGYLFPDTYMFFEDATAEEIVREMIDTMEARVATAGLMEQVGDGKQFATLHEALTLASIIEKEVRTKATMASVADIFLKRLAIGMALQSDATVNYITGGDDPSVSLADLAIDSPYNTYKYPGLPPGPISNPGLNALSAVASPTSNDYYYFLTTDEGDIHYATTHDEHVANKAWYLK